MEETAGTSFGRNNNALFSLGQGDQIMASSILLGDRLLWEVLLKITKVADILGNCCPQIWLCNNFGKNGLGYILGDFFSQPHLVTLLFVHVFLCRSDIIFFVVSSLSIALLKPSLRFRYKHQSSLCSICRYSMYRMYM
jgi:hypothetical protein